VRVAPSARYLTGGRRAGADYGEPLPARGVYATIRPYSTAVAALAEAADIPITTVTVNAAITDRRILLMVDLRMVVGRPPHRHLDAAATVACINQFAVDPRPDQSGANRSWRRRA
jgi:hypothetical protein